MTQNIPCISEDEFTENMQDELEAVKTVEDMIKVYTKWNHILTNGNDINNKVKKFRKKTGMIKTIIRIGERPMKIIYEIEGTKVRYKGVENALLCEIRREYGEVVMRRE